jgi:Ribosomal L25p family
MTAITSRRALLWTATVPLLSSASSARLLVDPSTLVDGMTRERVENDPDALSFLQANFPEAFEKDEEEEEDDDDEYDDEEDEVVAEKNAAVAAAGVRHEEEEEQKHYPLNIRPLHCYKRDAVGETNSRRSRHLRWHDNMIPGILLGGDPTLGIYSHQKDASKTLIKTEWRVLQRELDRYHRNFESRVYNLTVHVNFNDDSSSTVHRVIPASVQRHPVKETIYCCNFVRYHAGRPIHLPVVYINQEESPSLKRGGFMIPIQRRIECFVEDGAAIPEFLEVESTGLSIKGIVRTDRVLLPDGVRFSDRVLKRGKDYIIGVVQDVGRDLTTDGAAAGADGDATAAAPAAAGEKKAAAGEKKAAAGEKKAPAGQKKKAAA